MDYLWIVEVNIFCSIIMAIVLYSLYKNYDKQTKQRYYKKSVFLAILSFLCEMTWGIIEGRFIPAPRLANFITNGCYDIFTILMAYYWLCYVEAALGSNFSKHKSIAFLAKLPVIIIAASVVLSYFNGFLFYIDENNFYRRGNFVVLHVVLCQIYTIITSIHAFVCSVKTKVYIKTVEYRILSMFLFFPLAIGLIQIIVPAVPSISVGVTLAFLFVYIDLQNLLISVDTLSGLNNRNQLLRYLGARIKSGTEHEKLYVFMLDINNFKKINDTYGHVEGDAALVRCSEALKKIDDEQDYFIGRYGGDEFIIIAELESDEEADVICLKIKNTLASICERDKVPYELAFSFGYASYSPSMRSIQAFIAAADEKLYQAKKKRIAAV